MKTKSLRIPAYSRWVTQFSQHFRAFFEQFVPEAYAHTIEQNRRANLLVGFGFLGGVFGLAFSLFYFLIHHYWGSLVVLLCSVVIAMTPILLRRGLSLDWSANLINCSFFIGFTLLCALEGGLRGHAIAWMVSLPLCSLLLLSNHPMTYVWCGLSTLVTTIFIWLHLTGHELIPFYPKKWEPVVSAAGYLSLLLFMFLLGLIFETNRRYAQARMNQTLTALELANKNLARLNQDKNEFMNMAAHDIKNPLGVIIGYSELMLMGDIAEGEEKNRCLEQIQQAAEQAKNLVIQLLDVDAIEQGRITMNLQTCPLKEVLQTIGQRNLSSANRKGIQINLEGLPNEPLLVLADVSLLTQILDNLLSNAIKFSPFGKTIELSTYRDSRLGIVEVRDNGPGLSEEDQKKLFTKFARLSARPTGSESSHGLGLFLVKKMTETMHGQVFCRSTIGQGSIFGVRLPLADNFSHSPQKVGLIGHGGT